MNKLNQLKVKVISVMKTIMNTLCVYNSVSSSSCENVNVMLFDGQRGVIVKNMETLSK